MSRQNFPKSVKVDCIKAATVNGVIYCACCGLPTKRFEIDHKIPDGLTGKPTLDNAMLLCRACHGVKTPQDVARIAKAKRQEANHLGVKPSGPKMQSRPKPDKPPPKAPVPGMSNIARRFR